MDLTLKESVNVLEPTANVQNNAISITEPPSPSSFSLPKEPLITIIPSKSWAAIDFRDLWAHRELLYLLMWRELRARYKQTIMGVAWVVMQPLMTTIIYTLFLGKLARVPSDGIPYPIFAYAGLLTWSFFSGAVANSCYSVISSANLITKVYFPRLIIPCATVGSRLVDFAVAFLILFAMMIYYGVVITWSIIMLPVMVVLITLMALGIGTWVAALNVKYRDVGVALSPLLQVWMFASPIIYPSSLVPPAWRQLYALNPMVGIIENFRASLFGLKFNWTALAFSTVFTLVMLIYSAYFFRRKESGFADLV